MYILVVNIFLRCVHIMSCSARRPKSKKNVAMSQKRLPMEELSAITEVSESGHSTHTTLPSSSEMEGGGAAEEPVPKKRWVRSGAGLHGACGHVQNPTGWHVLV